MPRLFDHVAKIGYEDCVWILADDMLSLFYGWADQVHKPDMTMSQVCDLMPCIALPSDNIFLEYALRRHDALYVGAAIRQWRNGDVLFSAEVQYFQQSPRGEVSALQILTRMVYDETGRVLIIGHYAMPDKEYHLISYLLNQRTTPSPAMSMFDPPHDQTLILLEDEYSKKVNYMVMPFLFFLSMMNTKNVEIKDVEPPRKANQRHIEKHGKPMLSYKVLRVHPATVVHYKTRQDAPTGSTPIPRPLHTVRGHFKDYRDGKGLFGRFKDIFWFPEQLRGSPENGIAVKDYQLVPDPKKRKD